MAAEILIVDDRVENLQALEVVLGTLDRSVIRAESGDAALKILLEREVAVILLDVRMSELDGFETAALIRGNHHTSQIPIIFMTAYDDDLSQSRRAYDLGAFDYIRKPFDAEIVRQKVAAFVRLFEQSEQLRAAREQARLRDTFVGVLGHDLRGPLAAVQMSAQALQKTSLSDRQNKDVDRILRAASRMAHLVTDILDFVHGQLTGGIPIHPATTSLLPLIRQIVDEVQTANPGKQISLSESSDVEGLWDAARLEQVFGNLVANAIQHGTRDWVRVAVESHEDCARISVTSVGVIAPETAAHIFEPFQRGESKAPGLGLGLFIVRQIIEAHGGTVEVTADPVTDETTFMVTLPCASESIHKTALTEPASR